MYVVAAASDCEPDLWQALADPTRRHLIDRLAQGPLATSALCEGVPMTRFGVMKHLGVLERAGLVIARRHGRLRLNYLNAAPLHALHRRWVSPRAARLGEFARSITTLAEGKEMAATAAAGTADVALDWEIEAPVQRIWNAIFEDIDRWWPAAHRALQDSKLSLEEEVGARLLERGGDGSSLLWYTVIALQPMRSVDLVGHLAARFGGPATSLLHLELAPGAAEGRTLLRMTDSLVGAIGGEGRSQIAEGWHAILGLGLATFAEARR